MGDPRPAGRKRKRKGKGRGGDGRAAGTPGTPRTLPCSQGRALCPTKCSFVPGASSWATYPALNSGPEPQLHAAGPGKGPEVATEASVSSSRPGLGWQCGLWRAPLGWVTQGRRVTGAPKQPACLSRRPGLSSQSGRLGWGRQERPGSQRGTDLLAQFTCCLPTPHTWPSLEERRGNTPPQAALTPREGEAQPGVGAAAGRRVPACS